jgi:hypothetical protein
MSYQPVGKKNHKESEVTDALMGALEFFAKLIMYAGLLATIVGAGFLIYYVVLYSGYKPPTGGDPKMLVETFRKILTTGLLAFFIGSAYLFWGEGWMEMVQIIVSVLFFLAPMLGPMAFPNAATSSTGIPMLALVAIRTSAMGAGIVAVMVVFTDIFIKVQARFQQGTKADQLKYGKGIKEEIDRKNVFMGKCWQLPYCRKFVRERCPIYHARRCCWREKVGCMCEEEVIKGAMENRTIPKDAVAAARYIPHNNKLTLIQKMERCRQCVIYNEHQKHKYRLLLPVTLIGFVGICALLWPFLMAGMRSMFAGAQNAFKDLAVRQDFNAQIPDFLQQIILASICLVILTYLLKLLEFFIFKLKI